MKPSSKNAREVALDALTAWETGGVWSSRKLSDAIDRAGLDKRDAALTTFLCGGIIQNRILIDYHIAHHSSIRLKKLETRVLCILRLGAFQLMLSDSIPQNAAVNETVALCSKKDRRTVGFVNAVLRGMTGITDPYAIEETDRIRYLSIRYSHPEWICRELIHAVGEEEAIRVLDADNTAPPVTIQINTLRNSTEEAISSLEDEQVVMMPHVLLPDCLNLKEVGAIDRLKSYRCGRFWVQDAASMLAIKALDPKSGDCIFDACSAPGGKSFAAAVLSKGETDITAYDIHEDKLTLIRDGARRLGIQIKVGQGDARIFRPEFAEKYDKIICDVPCSGLGIIRKKPDIRFIREEKVTELPLLQSAILQNVSAYLKPGGTILYSTCTWREAENIAVIRAFLSKNPDFSLSEFLLPAPLGKIASGFITLWPRNFAFDGFFICLMRKNNV